MNEEFILNQPTSADLDNIEALLDRNEAILARVMVEASDGFVIMNDPVLQGQSNYKKLQLAYSMALDFDSDIIAYRKGGELPENLPAPKMDKRKLFGRVERLFNSTELFRDEEDFGEEIARLTLGANRRKAQVNHIVTGLRTVWRNQQVEIAQYGKEFVSHFYSTYKLSPTKYLAILENPDKYTSAEEVKKAAGAARDDEKADPLKVEKLVNWANYLEENYKNK